MANKFGGINAPAKFQAPAMLQAVMVGYVDETNLIRRLAGVASFIVVDLVFFVFDCIGNVDGICCKFNFVYVILTYPQCLFKKQKSGQE